jgi:diketogulonate reductase-like aldo/keto reductase
MTVPKFTLSSGDQIPRFGLGTWQSQAGTLVGVVKKAIELGYRHLDFAEMYQNQKEIGEGSFSFFFFMRNFRT